MVEEVKPTGKGTAKKPEPKKDPKKGQGLEEITDHRPREISYDKDFSVETGDQFEVTDQVAIFFSKAFMSLTVSEVNRETLEEKVQETIKVDLSCLLFPTDKCNVSVFLPSHPLFCSSHGPLTN